MEVLVVTSAQHPAVRTPVEVIEGIEHRRTPPYMGGYRALWREWHLMRRLQPMVARAATEWRPDVIHAHSPVLVGCPALQVARRLRLPFVYEVRDLWENASVDRGRFRHNSLQYRLAQALESFVLNRSRAVVTICDTLRTELTTRMNTREGIHVVPNGVDVSAFSPGPELSCLRDRLRLENKRVLLYAGAFQPYEGLPVLIEAMAAVVTRVPQAHLLIVGGGSAQSAPEPASTEHTLRTMVVARGLASHVTFAGQVPHAEVAGYYSLADVVVYPRIRTRTTALTTPLKPLEAMACGRAIVISDLPPMRELVIEGVTGLSFPPGDASALADRCLALLRNPVLRNSLGVAARQFVTAHRQWSAVTARYKEIYARIVS
jgi:PEP-CTERM/exosortase A-associated glycosyltransferase